jgi:hypothetical protein
MAKTIVVTKKRRGPPATGKGIQVGERWHPPELAAIDNWISLQSEKLTRGQAIRRLVEIALNAGTSARPASNAGRRSRAAELAAKTIEKMIDPAAPPDERDRRRRRLTKGPLEFRDDRVDLPKAKK